jgi:hypothetical protein
MRVSPTCARLEHPKRIAVHSIPPNSNSATAYGGGHCMRKIPTTPTSRGRYKGESRDNTSAEPPPIRAPCVPGRRRSDSETRPAAARPPRRHAPDRQARRLRPFMSSIIRADGQRRFGDGRVRLSTTAPSAGALSWLTDTFASFALRLTLGHRYYLRSRPSVPSARSSSVPGRRSGVSVAAMAAATAASMAPVVQPSEGVSGA